jgi:hypothetical protein
MRAIAIAVAGVLGVLSSAGAAAADPPVKAKMLQGELVTAYEACETPDTTTDGGVPACTTVRSDPACGFGPSGSGKVKLKVGGGERPKVSGRIRGLEAGCAGVTLYFEASMRFTGDQCQGSMCTSQDFTAALGFCVVDASLRCALTTMPPFFNPPPPPGGEYAVLGARVVRNFSGNGRVFDVGFLLPAP